MAKKSNPSPASGWNTPPLEVEPSGETFDKCGELGCSNPAFKNGFCRDHSKGKKRRGRARVEIPEDEPIPTTEEGPAQEEITQAAVESVVVTAMQFLATTLDESYSAIDVKQAPNGEVVSMTVKPHVKEAVAQMMPWMKIYGGQMMEAAPWFGFIGGCFALVAPALDPTIEIIAGVRKPRIVRSPKPGDPDVYSDAFKAAQARAAAREQESNAERNESRASQQVVDVGVRKAG